MKLLLSVSPESKPSYGPIFVVAFVGLNKCVYRKQFTCCPVDVVVIDVIIRVPFSPSVITVRFNSSVNSNKSTMSAPVPR